MFLFHCVRFFGGYRSTVSAGRAFWRPKECQDASKGILFVAYLEREQQLWIELASIAEDEGLRLYDVETRPPMALRVFIDRNPAATTTTVRDESDGPAEGAGEENVGPRVTSKDCTRFCRRLMVFFLAEGTKFGFTAEPEIEVSSPGMNRSLRTAEHFARAVGERVKIVPNDGVAIDGKPAHTIVGNLVRWSDEIAHVEDETTHANVAFRLQDIKRANVDFPF